MSQNDKGEVFIPCNFAAGGTHSEKCIRISTSAAIAKPVSEIGEFIEDVRWNVTFKNPNVQRALRRLAAEALEEYEAGEAEEGGFAIE